jgi:hypothetical protein
MGGNVAPALSPDARTIAFVRGRLTDAPVIATMPAGGGQVTTITAPAQPASGGGRPEVRPPSWSPDGSRIAYLSTIATESDPVVGVYTADADGSHTRLIWKPGPPSPSVGQIELANTGPTPGGSVSTVESVSGVDWTPDGRLVLLIATTQVDASGGVGPSSLRFIAMDPDGTDPAPLTLELPLAGSFRVSPDGNRIAFSGSVEPGRPDIYVMNIDGSGRTQLTTDKGSDQDPTWSPDGTQIAFSSEATGFPQISVVSASGGTPRQVTHTTGRVANCQPSWRVSADPLPKRPVARGDANDPFTLQLGERPPGTYASAPFEPAFQVTLPAGWEGVSLSSDALYLFRTQTSRVRIEVNQVQVVFDETRRSPGQAVAGHCIDSPTKVIGPTPLDFINWLQTDKDLSLGTIYPTSSGGANGVRVHVTVHHVPGDKGCAFLGQKTALYPFANDQFALQIDDIADFLVLDVHGTRVIVTLFGPAADLDAVAGETQGILDSIRFP